MKVSHRWTALILVALLGSGAAAAQPVDPRRIASCQLAAENMRERVRPETDAFAQYNADVTYWSDRLVEHVPEAATRESLLAEGREVLRGALAQQGYMAGMTMVGGVLSQCNAARGELPSVAPNG